MMKFFAFCSLFTCLCLTSKADHITGGEIYYTYSPENGNSFKYTVTFKLFMRCYSNRQFNNPTIISVFNKETNERVSDINVPLASSETISVTSQDPCISNPPQVCYVVGYYNFSLSLPASTYGYVIASQVNFRISGINNLVTGYSNIGATYTAEIPGTQPVSNGAANNSAKFTGNDLVIICAKNRFSYSFGASDPDKDELSYSFCSAYRSTGGFGGGFGGGIVAPTLPPPFQSVPYGNNFTDLQPLGGEVQINPATGLITGVAPEAGIYIITVCVTEKRNGKIIAVQRKDLQVNIAPCNIAGAVLDPSYTLCRDTKTIELSNLSTSPLIRSNYWQLINRNGSAIYTSTDLTLRYTFADTGTYTVRLAINRNEACNDSTAAIIKVYPGFKPGFTYKGICISKPTVFTDKTVSGYGKVITWNWEFGTGENSLLQNVSYNYPSEGTRTVVLQVSNSVGCTDSVSQRVSVVEKPPINLAFTDTLVCTGDAVKLLASASGNFNWTPVNNVVNANTSSPVVSPVLTTAYTVHVNDNGCTNTALVTVRVVDHVSVQAMSDTIVCQGDTIQLRTESDGTRFSWQPAAFFINPLSPNPLVVATKSSTFKVLAGIGSCTAADEVLVTTVPYPYVFAGNDTVICFRTMAQLHGETDGASFKWSPAAGLSDVRILNPVTTPAGTITYLLSATDTKGCPKPASDVVRVTVLPRVEAFAGNDTIVVVNQPLQMHGSGGSFYLWSPAVGLSDAHIPDPVALYIETFNTLRYRLLVSNEAGCADSAFVKVTIFNTLPSIFVPTAFTPNGDQKNDVLRPVVAGMKQFEFFKIYNRWGQLVFTTVESGKGWDGTISGTPQGTGTYVWMVRATDYQGNAYFKKGTVTLIK